MGYLQKKTWSKGDFAYQSYSNAYVIDLIVTEESADLDANTSVVSYRLQLRSGGNNRFTGDLPCYVVINGKKTAKTVTINAAYNHTYLLISGQATVPHDSTGTKTLQVEGHINGISNKYAPPALTIKESFALTKIPRASSFWGTDAAIESNSAITINSASAAFKHSIAYKFGTLSGYIGPNGTLSASEVKLSGTSVRFAVPAAFYAQIPNSKSGEVQLTCRTYSGNTILGSPTTASVTVTASAAKCSPAVSGSVADSNSTTVALTGDNKKLIRFASIALVTISAAGKNGATIKSKTVNGRSVSGSTVSENEVESGKFTLTATDSRGYAATKTMAAPIVPYINLTATITGSRLSPTDGTARISISGDYFSGTFGVVGNTLVAKYRKAGDVDWISIFPVIDGNRYTATADLTGVDYKQNVDFEVMVFDQIRKFEKTVTIRRGIPVYNWGENFFKFNVPIYGEYFEPQPNLYVEDLDTAYHPGVYILNGLKLAGLSGTWYGIFLVFSSRRDAGNAAWVQIACGHTGRYAIRNRYYKVNQWSPWKEL